MTRKTTHLITLLAFSLFLFSCKSDDASKRTDKNAIIEAVYGIELLKDQETLSSPIAHKNGFFSFVQDNSGIVRLIHVQNDGSIKTILNESQIKNEMMLEKPLLSIDNQSLYILSHQDNTTLKIYKIDLNTGKSILQKTLGGNQPGEYMVDFIYYPEFGGFIFNSNVGKQYNHALQSTIDRIKIMSINDYDDPNDQMFRFRSLTYANSSVYTVSLSNQLTQIAPYKNENPQSLFYFHFPVYTVKKGFPDFKLYDLKNIQINGSSQLYGSYILFPLVHVNTYAKTLDPQFLNPEDLSLLYYRLVYKNKSETYIFSTRKIYLETTTEASIATTPAITQMFVAEKELYILHGTNLTKINNFETQFATAKTINPKF